MLLQRLRASEASVEASIAYNLVDLALPAAMEVFLDITKSFSHISMASLHTESHCARNNAVGIHSFPFALGGLVLISPSDFSCTDSSSTGFEGSRREPESLLDRVIVTI